MPTTINVNGLSLCHKDSGGYSSADLPDVCLTPPGRDPVPYSNVATQADLVKGTTSVTADGGNMCANDGSEFARSTGDEAGSDGGIQSGTFMAEATWLTSSFDVKLEGRGASRLTDRMLHNQQNTANLAGKVQDPLDDAFIQCILKLCEKDPEIVKKLEELTVYTEMKRTYRLWEYQERPNPAGGKAIGEWKMVTDQGYMKGWASPDTKEIGLVRDQPCEEIQRTIVHEVHHTEQTITDRCEKEADAFAAEERWAIDRGLAESDQNRRKPKLRPDGTPEPGAFEPDTLAIAQMVNFEYVCNLPGGDGGRRQIQSRFGDAVLTLDRKVRNALPGDTFVESFPRNQRAMRHQIPKEALQCPPPKAPDPPPAAGPKGPSR